VQRVVVDDHHLGRVDGLRARLGDNDRHDVADEADDIAGERRARQRSRDHGKTLSGFEVEVVGRVHGDDARHRHCVARVDRLDAGMGHRRPDERQMEQTFDLEVVEVLGVAAQDARVLGAPHRVAEDRSRSCHGRKSIQSTHGAQR
jgi:hypothetical protein